MLIARTPLSKLKMRFHFGDIQLYVCEKVQSVAPVAAANQAANGNGADLPVAWQRLAASQLPGRT